jgi:hypothetical protein
MMLATCIEKSPSAFYASTYQKHQRPTISKSKLNVFFEEGPHLRQVTFPHLNRIFCKSKTPSFKFKKRIR